MRGISIALLFAIVRPLAVRADTGQPTADQLFEQATQEKAKGNLDKACELFAAALKLSPESVGSILNVAQCDEDAGRVHSAIVHFTRLKEVAEGHNLAEYARVADDHLAKLHGKAAQLGLTFENGELDAETKVTINGEDRDVTKTTTLEVDPGTLHVVISHPGRVAREEPPIEIKPGEFKAYRVDALAKPVTVKSTKRTIGIVMTAGGGAMAIIGAVVVALGKSHYDAQFNGPNPNCSNWGAMFPTNPIRCTSTGAIQGARLAINVGAAVGYTGLAVAGFGVYLWITGRKETKERVSIVPVVSPDQAGVLAVGHF